MSATFGLPVAAPDNAALLALARECVQAGQAVPAAALCAAVLWRQPDLVEARQLLDTLPESSPPDQSQWIETARMFHRAGRLDAAAALYARAYDLDPADPVPIQRLGVIAHQTGRDAAALDCFDRALALAPDYIDAHNNRGTVLAALHRPAEALASFDAVLRLDTDNAYAHNNRGNVLHELGRHADALDSFDRALALAPDYADACKNRGIVLADLGRIDDALASYARACQLVPDFAEAHWNAGLLHLLKGDFANGWREYEWGWAAGQRGDQPRHAYLPAWRGQFELAGKTILLWSEQGLGDAVQFCRFARQVAARGARVVLEVPRPLLPALAGLAGVAHCVAVGDALPAVDCQCPLLSLPLALGLTLADIDGAPYLTPPAAPPWCEPQTCGRPRIGVAWRGDPRHRKDAQRSIPFATFAHCLPTGPDYVCLLRDIPDADWPALRQRPDLRDMRPHLNDVGDTAALIQSLDLVIAVDTGIAHLAGALGKPAWVLLPHQPDWRWLQGRDDTPWYNSMTLIRQSKGSDWDDVLETVHQRIGERFAAGRFC
jgi:tetratricopeptide (TPR) repeat protein